MDHAEGGKTWGVEDANKHWVAKVHPGDGDAAGVLRAFERANLFAAAREMLEALEDLTHERAVVVHCPDSVLDRARAAFAKARGDIPW